MKRKNKRCKEKTPRIADIGITSDTLRSRGGLGLFVRSHKEEVWDYVEYINRLGARF